MKKLITLLTIGFLLIFLVGCGSTDTTEETTVDETEMEETVGDLKDDIVGTWQATVAEEENEMGDEVSASLVDKFVFNEDGTYEATSYVSAANDTENTVELTVEGTYEVKDDELTLTVNTIDGMTKDEYAAEEPTLTEDELNVIYETGSYSATIEDDTLTLVDPDGAVIELEKVM